MSKREPKKNIYLGGTGGPTLLDPVRKSTTEARDSGIDDVGSALQQGVLDRRSHILLELAASELIDALQSDALNEAVGLRVELAVAAQRDGEKIHVQVLRESIILSGTVFLVGSKLQSIRVTRVDVVDHGDVDDNLADGSGDVEVRAKERMELRVLPH